MEHGTSGPDVQRLLEAWRGEVEAGAVYHALAARERDPRRAAVIARMAEVEDGHRQRLEARLRELGVPVPDASQVKLSLWRRAQVRLAPIERLLAAREAAENTEVAGRYGQPTGDTQTDRLLGELRQDERSHARQLATMRQSGTAGTASLVESKLQHILGRETWHQTGTGWISGAIYGANDGLAAVFGIVSGVAGATGGSSFVLTAGLAGALASALSMATGAFLAERSQGEVAAANLAQERQEIEERPEEEKEELSLYYQLKGLDQQEADVLAEKLSQNPDAFLHLLAAEELGGAKAESGNPAQAALAAGVSTGIGALIPVLPFFWLHGALAVLIAAAISLVAHFLVGAAKSLFTLRSWWAAGLEMTLAGVIVGGVTFAAGLLFHA
ncbi:MAG: VIT1/CCC1 transporter family protein [Chloroflexi bacterium]|nr:VIT1/CCC1 transporter family protein [Chloroflexota bacterium]